MKTQPRAPLSAEFVRSILEYDPSTGVFRWRVRPDRNLSWNARYAGRVAGTITRFGYVTIRVENGGPHHRAHVLAWLYVHGEWRPDEIDHRYGVRDDNRIEHLRLTDKSGNGCNKRMQRNNTSGFVGVDRWCGKWRGRVHHCRTTVWCRYFDSAEEAAVARENALRTIHGEFTITDPLRPRYEHPRDRHR